MPWSEHLIPENVCIAHGVPLVDGARVLPAWVGRALLRMIFTPERLHAATGQSTIPRALLELKHGS
jgi:hypothetical protein